MIENGVAFIGDETEQPYAYDLVMRELNVSTYEFAVWGPGDCKSKSPFSCTSALVCRQSDGEVHNFTNLFPDIITNKCVGDPIAISSLLLVTGELIEMSNQIDLEEPWNHPKAEEWDTMTFGEWLRERMDKNGFEYMRITVEPDLCENVDDVSLLHVLFLAKTAHGVFDGLYAFNNGRRIRGGGSVPALQIFQDLNRTETNMQFNTYVESIRVTTTENSSVEVRVQDGRIFTSRHVVLTGVPSVTSRIEFDPPLRSEKRAALEQMRSGHVVRAMAIYQEGPFWRKNGLSGSYGDLDPNFVKVGLGYDMTPSDPKRDGYIINNGVPGVIQVETIGRVNSSFLIQELERVFGSEMSNPSQVLSFDFNDVPTLGGGKSSYAVGSWFKFGKYLRESHADVIHWAGTEYSSEGFGYLEGAARSANMTAEMLIRTLRNV